MSDLLGNYIVYLNGVEVPTRDVTVNGGIWTMPTATISMAPHRCISRLGAEDRIQVAIFYLDQYYEQGRNVFKLLFEGEIVSWSYTKTEQTRLIQFEAISHISIFTQIFMYLIGSSSSKNFGSGARFENSNPAVIKVSTFYPTAFFYNGLVGHKLVNRPFDFIENIMGAILGTASTTIKSKRKTKAVEDFGATIAANYVAAQVKLYGEISKQTVKGAKTAQEYLEILEEQSAQYADSSSIIGDLDLDVISGNVKSEFTPTVTPVVAGPVSIEENKKETKNQSPQDLATEYKQHLLSNKIENKQGTKVKRSVVATNFFMRWMRLTKFVDHFVASPYFEDSNVIGDKKGIFPILRALKNKEGVDALIKITGAKQGAQNVWQMIQKVFNAVFYEITMICAPPAVIVNRDALPIRPPARDMLFLSSDDLKIKFKQMAKQDERLRIASFITKPMSIFGLPPSCNVFFPCMYNSYEFTEMYRKQLTRLYMSSSKDPKAYGPAGLVKNNKGIRVAYPREIDKQAQKQGVNSVDSEYDDLVWPEEYFRGPVVDSRQFPEYLKSIAAKTTSKRKQDTQQQEEKDNAEQSENVPVSIENGVKGVPPEFQQEMIAALDNDLDGAWEYTQKQGTDDPNESHGTRARFSAKHTVLTKSYEQGVHLDQTQADILVSKALKINKIKNTSKNKTTLERAEIAEQLKKEGAPTSVTEQLYKERTSKSASSQDSKGNTISPGNDGAVKADDAAAELEKTKKHIKNVITKQALHKLYYDFARQEYFREKYQHRTLQISGVFNPYPIPGLPAFIFDDEAVGIHNIGVIINFSHTLSNEGHTGSTFVTSFNRTFDEFCENIVKDGMGLDAGPAEAIPEIRYQLQKMTAAREYYRRLFHQNLNTANQNQETTEGTQAGDRAATVINTVEIDPVADWTAIFGWASNTPLGWEPIITDPKNPQYNMQYNRDVRATMPFLFNDLNSAMAYVSRPVCSLEEYIAFYQGIRYTPLKITGQPVQSGPTIDPNKFEEDFVYYVKIRNLNPWEGEFDDPAKKEKNIKELPDSRRDWQKTLLYYRDQIADNKIQNY